VSGPAGTPLYKGEPLDADRGPGLGCFWSQVVVLVILVVLTPIGVANAWPQWLTTVMLFATLILLLLAGQTVIFLLRLVAADRRTRRRPLRATTPTVGQIEDTSTGGDGTDADDTRTGRADDAQSAGTPADDGVGADTGNTAASDHPARPDGSPDQREGVPDPDQPDDVREPDQPPSSGMRQ
jgi:hypothetical protein